MEKNINKMTKGSEKDIPIINFPYAEWLPDSVKNAIENHLFFLKGQGDIRVFNAMSGLLNKKIENLSRFEKIFNNRENMEQIWIKLDKISSKKTYDFVLRLFAFFDNFRMIDDGSRLRREVEIFETKINYMNQLEELLTYNSLDFFSLESSKEAEEILKNIKMFKEKSLPMFNEKLKHLEEMNKLNYSRENKHKNAEAVYFAREISKYFRNNFKKPFNEITVIMVNLIFNTDYEEANISIFYNAVKRQENEPYLKKVRNGEIDKFYKF